MLVTRIWKIGGERPLNPAHVAKTAAEYNWPMQWHGVVNGVTCPRGRPYGEANFLLSSESLSKLDLTQPQTIELVSEDGTQQLTEYYVIRTQAISRDVDQPPHWVTLADRRWLYEKIVANSRYNMRTARKGTKDHFVKESTNSGTPYTWQEIIDDLWDMLPAGSAGATAPLIPFEPDSTPENLDFENISVWGAINLVLTAIGCSIVYRPLLQTDVFAIVQLSETQLGLAAYLAAVNDRVLWNFRPQTLTEVHYPKEAYVSFQKVPGGGETPWLEQADVEVVTVDLLGNPTMKWSVMDTMFSWDNNALKRTERAEEIAVALVGLLKPLARPWGVVYAGVLPLFTGEDITSVEWCSDGERGMRTIVRHAFDGIDWPKLPTLYNNAATIEYTIDDINDGTGEYEGLKVADVTVRCGPGGLIGETVKVVDHSGCNFDEETLTGYTGWAFWGQAWSMDEGDGSLDPGDPCETLTPPHWIAFTRCCDANTGTYRDPC